MSDFGILSFLIRSLRLSLTSPATLEHLKFSIVFEGIDYHFNRCYFYHTLRMSEKSQFTDLDRHHKRS
jgi:hypothetical protein